MRIPPIANSYGHHGHTLDSVTATMWPKASAPSTTGAVAKTTRKSNAIMAEKEAKTIANTRYKEGKVSFSQNRYNVNTYARMHIYRTRICSIYIYMPTYYHEIKLIHALHVMETNRMQ